MALHVFYIVLSQTHGHTHAHTIKEIKDTSPKEKFGSVECLCRRWSTSLARARDTFCLTDADCRVYRKPLDSRSMIEHVLRRPSSADPCKFYYPPTTGRPPTRTRTSRDRPFFRVSSRTPSSPLFSRTPMAVQPSHD